MSSKIKYIVEDRIYSCKDMTGRKEIFTSCSIFDVVYASGRCYTFDHNKLPKTAKAFINSASNVKTLRTFSPDYDEMPKTEVVIYSE